MSASIPGSPSLAAPGAGLPAAELFVARILFRVQCWRTSRVEVGEAIARERTRIETLIGACVPEAAQRRVLIARPRGLEDSSRYWSLLMTLDHLRIVNTAVAQTISTLAAGRRPSGTVSTATVKPAPSVGREVIAAFGESCALLLDAATGVESLATPLRHAHPWFGPLDAAGWYFLGGFHLALHRRQIELIQRELTRIGP